MTQFAGPNLKSTEISRTPFPGVMLAMRSVILLVAALSATLGVRTPAQCPPRSVAPLVGKAEPFEDEIVHFEAADRISPPQKGSVVFVGSSSIRVWPNLQADFPNSKVLQRGFGGSTLAQVDHYAPRIVLPYCPRLIVLYAGDNDLAEGRSPEQILADFKTFVGLVRSPMPNTRIVFVSIKPSTARVALLEKMREANALIRQYIAADPSLTYVDVFTPMLGPTGLPRGELFQSDGLHMNAQGYAIWQGLLQPLVSATAR
jgi:lysophospholipase L1-like esterase